MAKRGRQSCTCQCTNTFAGGLREFFQKSDKQSSEIQKQKTLQEDLYDQLCEQKYCYTRQCRQTSENWICQNEDAQVCSRKLQAEICHGDAKFKGILLCEYSTQTCMLTATVIESFIQSIFSGLSKSFGVKRKSCHT